MVTKFNCPCGNQDPKKVEEYDGVLGYQALICESCGATHDDTGIHLAVLSFEEACKQARKELVSRPDDALDIACKYAQQVDDDFNHCADAIYCEITDILN